VGLLHTAVSMASARKPPLDREASTALYLALRGEIQRLAEAEGARLVCAMTSGRQSLERGTLGWREGILRAPTAPGTPQPLLVVDLDPVFLEATERDSLFIPGDAHWSARGHEAVGKLLAAELSRGLAGWGGSSTLK
jgi:hypothetical protein